MTMKENSGFHPTQLLVLVAVLGTATFIYSGIWRWLVRRQFAAHHGCQPVARSSNKDPFLGLDAMYRLIRSLKEHKSLEMMEGQYRLYGNTFTSKHLLTHGIITAEPENVKTILAVNFKDYGIGHRHNIFSPLLGTGIFDTDGQHWAMSRALIRPNFARDQVADLTLFENLILELFSLIPGDGKSVIDLQDLFFRYTTDSATEFLFGKSAGSLKEKQSELGFPQAFNYALGAITMRYMLGPLSIFYRDSMAKKCNRVCREYAQQFVEEAVRVVQDEKEVGNNKIANAQDKRQKYVFSHELARQTTDKRRILDECLNVLLAGRDTTASLLSNMFFMLAKHPVIWAKLCREVDSLQGRLPTYQELRNLKYLKCCMNESLRLHPVVPVNERVALRDTVLPLGGGEDGRSPVFVPKGTMVGYNVYAMHRRSDFYGNDAEEFRPERWESGLQPRWEYLPFNGGARICIGQQYALTEVGYVTVRMAQKFRTLESRDPGPWEESLTLTLCSRNGAKMCLTST